MVIVGPNLAKEKLFELYKCDGYVNAFLHIRWWHANLEKVAEFVPKSGTILDLGCGYGFMSNYLALESPERKILGVELSERKAQYARKGLPNVNILSKDIMNINIPPCDAILFLDLLHHLKSYQEQANLLDYCTKMLSPTGTLIVKEINEEPKLKFLLAFLIDNLLYPGDRFYYGSEVVWKLFLEQFGLNVTFHPIHKGKPLSHVVYVGRIR